MVDLYSESTAYQQSVWDTGTLTEGTHTVLIEWTGTKNEASSGTTIGVDALDITAVPDTGQVSTGVWAQATQDGQQNTVISLELATIIAQRQVLRYAGYCYDSESGLYYLSARHYDPVSRQFLCKDLSRNDGEQSAYQYCLGNPILGVDPSGFRPLFETGSRETDAEAMRQYAKTRQAQAKKRAAASAPTISASAPFLGSNHSQNLHEGTNSFGVQIPFLYDAPTTGYPWWVFWADRHWDSIYNGLAVSGMRIVVTGGKVSSVECLPVRNVRPQSGASSEYLGVDIKTFQGGWGPESTLWGTTTFRTVNARWTEACSTLGVYNQSAIHSVEYGVIVCDQAVMVVSGTFADSSARGTPLIPENGKIGKNSFEGQHQGMFDLLNNKASSVWNLQDIGNP
jgi:RHS repeat-associated protein